MCMLVHTDADQIARKPAIDTNQKKSRKATESKNSLIKNTLSEPFRPANQASGPGGCFKLKNFFCWRRAHSFYFFKKRKFIFIAKPSRPAAIQNTSPHIHNKHKKMQEAKFAHVPNGQSASHQEPITHIMICITNK